jgi:hypothetical protein
MIVRRIPPGVARVGISVGIKACALRTSGHHDEWLRLEDRALYNITSLCGPSSFVGSAELPLTEGAPFHGC